MIKINLNNNHHTEFKTYEYFPIFIDVYDTIENIKYVEYTHENNLLEFSIDKDALTISRMKLVLCDNFIIKNEKIALPFNHTEGNIIMDVDNKNITDFFSVIVYEDGAEICLSKSPTHHYFKTDSLLLGVNSMGELTNIIISNLSKKEVAHIIDELNYMIEN